MAVNAKPAEYHTVTPFLYVSNVAQLLKFLKEAFGAVETMQQRAPDGAIMHAEVKIGDSIIMMSEKSINYPAMPAMLYLYVEDVDGTYRRALGAGATKLREPEDLFYGDRSGAVTDPCGNQWWISKHIEDVTPEQLKERLAKMEQRQT